MSDPDRYRHGISIDPNDLKPGIDYAISKRVPLMPDPDPLDDKAVELLGKMKWLKKMVPFRVGEKTIFKSGTWFRVTRIGVTELADACLVLWVNRNALCGAMLLPVGVSKEVQGVK